MVYFPDYAQVKSRISETYTSPPRQGFIIVDASANSKSIEVQNGFYGTCEDDVQQIRGVSGIIPWINSLSLKQLSESMDNTKRLIQENSRCVSINNHSLRPPFYVVCEQARFSFQSDSYARVTDDTGTVIPVSNSSLQLDSVVITIDDLIIKNYEEILKACQLGGEKVHRAFQLAGTGIATTVEYLVLGPFAAIIAAPAFFAAWEFTMAKDKSKAINAIQNADVQMKLSFCGRVSQ
ncbi:hypothetical protein HY486_02660 [Candidatus Woesearchaeota archaeon]|nr:hypothetical protein [Candidatus Woesearchaeota archaeon]